MDAPAPTRPIAFLFPGQGSQSVGMGKDLAQNFPLARDTFSQADAALDYPLTQLCFEGPEEKLKLTELTQPAILTASIAACRVLQEHGIKPDYLAGHSLGEYSAHVVAGTFGFIDAVVTVRKRGKYMQEAVPVGVGAMAAVLGFPLTELRTVCEEAAQGEVVSPANINSTEQTVISGHKAAVERAVELAKQRGAKRTVMLPVSAPFHCALMQPAQDLLAVDLEQLKLSSMLFPVSANIDGKLRDSPDAARAALVQQVTGAVEWVACIHTLIARGVETFVEIGPGKVLCGLMRQIDRSKTCLNVEDVASLKKTLASLAPDSAPQS